VENPEVQNPNFIQTEKLPMEPVPVPAMSTVEWIVTLLIMIVPVLNLVMLIIWASDRNTNLNKANWAKATLILIGIQVIIFMFFIGTIIGSASSLMSELSSAGLW
jgi:hypothetical protein